MNDKNKTKEELLKEIIGLRRRNVVLEIAEAERKKLEEREVVKRKPNEEMLRVSEEKWRSLVKNAPNIILVVDREGKIQFINHTVSGLTPEEVIGRKHYDYIEPEYHKKVKETIQKVFQTGEPNGYQIRGVCPQGTFSWYETKVGPIKSNGKIVAVILITSDISNQKRLTVELEEINRFMQNILDSSSSISIISTDLEGKLLYWNKGAENIFGYKAEEVVGSQKIDILYPPDDEETKKIIEAARSAIFREKKGISCEIREVTKEGSKLWIRLTLSSRLDENGQVVGILGIGEDITERKLSEEALKESEEKCRKILSSSPDAITVTDLDGKIVECNQATLDIHGFSMKEELIARNAFELIASKDHERASENLKKTLEQGYIGNLEYTFLTKDGREFPAELSVSLIRDTIGNPMLFVGITKDITQRKVTEEELNKYREHLEELVIERTSEIKKINEQLRREIAEREMVEDARRKAESQLEEQRILSIHADRLRSLGEMAAGIAHELNQPLVGVRGLAEHLIVGMERGWDLKEEKLRSRLTRIIEQADRMSHIIDHVRVFAREAGKPELNLVNVNDVVRSAMSMLKEQFRSHGLKWEWELAESLPFVSANPFSLEEVILNLIINARDAVEEYLKKHSKSTSPQVLLRTFLDSKGSKQYVKIEIIDWGIGIPQQLLSKVFDPFLTTKGPDRGTGLGLSISKSIVEQFGGTIDIKSASGQGTTAVISLPVSQT